MSTDETQHAWACRQLRRYHKPGWRMTLEPGGLPEAPSILVVRYRAEDSRGSGQVLDLTARRHLGPFENRDPQWFGTDLRRTLLHGVYGHELDETLLRDGALLNDPHTAPDRWHCPCGGVGPVKRAAAWDCPGCGNTLINPEMGDTEP